LIQNGKISLIPEQKAEVILNLRTQKQVKKFVLIKANPESLVMKVRITIINIILSPKEVI